MPGKVSCEKGVITVSWTIGQLWQPFDEGVLTVLSGCFTHPLIHFTEDEVRRAHFFMGKGRIGSGRWYDR